MSEEKKLRHSMQRDRIEAYLLSSHTHPTAEQIYLDLKPEIPNLSLGTVYRNLKQLEEAGKVDRVSASGNTEHYEAKKACHAHFVCKKCGKVMDLDDIPLAKAEKLCHFPEGTEVSSVHITFEGICADCSRK